MKNSGILIGSFLLIVIIMVMTGCTPTKVPEPIVRTVEVKVPVIQYREPPASLKRTPIIMPSWIAPTDIGATSCVTAGGEKLFKGYVIDRETRLDIWEKSGFK